MTLPFRQLSAGLWVKRIDGVIGTSFFYHFLATLDFPHGELVLRRKTAESRRQFAGIFRQRRHSPDLDGERLFHGGLGSC
jgi:hypothetical protein